MAERRMFAKSIVLSDAFLDMPMSARCLYFTLGMFADDDGFVGSPKGIMRQCGASADDLEVLLAKRYVLAFKSGVIVIKHWRINNYLQSDRHKQTTYLEELATLTTDGKNAYTEKDKTACIQNVYTDQVSIGKDSIDKDNLSIYQEAYMGIGGTEEHRESVCDRLTDKQWETLNETYEDFIGLVDLIDERLKLSQEKINDPYAYIISVAKNERWATKKGVKI